MGAAVAHLEAVSEARHPFPMVLRVPAFRPISPVVFVRSLAAADCEVLEQAIRTAPRRRLDFYYHPHVTVAHHVPEPNLDRAFTELSDFEARFRGGLPPLRARR